MSIYAEKSIFLLLFCYYLNLYSIKGALALFCFSFFFWLRVLDKAEYSAFESTLNSPIVSYRIMAQHNG